MKTHKQMKEDVMSLLTHLGDIVRNRTGTLPSRDKKACFYAMAVLTYAVENLAAHFKGKKPEVREVREIYKKIISAGPVIFFKVDVDAFGVFDKAIFRTQKGRTIPLKMFRVGIKNVAKSVPFE